jgi:large subunit ribosomal protein L21
LQDQPAHFKPQIRILTPCSRSFARAAGHRQALTAVRITEILTDGKKPSKAAPKPEPKKAEKKPEAPATEAKAEKKPAAKKAESKPAAKKAATKQGAKAPAKKPAAKPKKK